MAETWPFARAGGKAFHTPNIGAQCLQSKTISATTRAMKSQWNDSAARADGRGLCRQRRRPGHRAQGLHHAPAWRAIRCSCCMAAATPRSRRGPATISAQEHEVIAVKGSGADMADIEPWGLPAVKLEPLQQAARARGAVRRGDGQRAAAEPARFRRRPTPRSRRCCMPSCRINSSTTPMPPRCCRWSISLTARRLAREVYDGRMGIVPYIAPGFGLAKAAAAGVRAEARRRGLDPAQARHLHLRRGLRARPMSA